MKPWLAFVLVSIAISANAGPSSKPTYPTLEPVVANMGPGCRVRLSIPNESRYSSNYIGYTDQGVKNSSWREGGLGFHRGQLPYRSDEWHFGLTCYSTDADQPRNEWVVFDSKKQLWTVNPANTDIIPEQHLKVYQVKTPNAQGWAYTDDDTAVEFPDRRMQYCVYHGDKAICGDTDVGAIKTIRRHPLADRTPYVLKILNSIEFLEDSPPSQNTSAP